MSMKQKFIIYLPALFIICFITTILSTNVEVSHLTAFTTCFLSILSAGFVLTLLIILRDY
ncbi:putative membrane protein [Francisella tularensis]|uniref:Membrane protein n=3 Tax=Francisella tularensis TaxID=263 RepID=A0AAW3D4R9_FRATU|nr:hypothetical protein [Francisella tularensis]ADA78441.1 hypothetical membrane protein [Francisella tularensis subsp. tularensis NE061598]AJI71784.1 putative membrane protein [Francisella tularensis subsp. tularensis]EET19119.1 conserved hypothetical protein [Francisella tularensis subsp. tularensis MA00-2987]EKM88422.1 membrane protein [Francisella tularensis subsp. tularensis 80700075]EOA43172.1 membrane protein [Francisella tularensis subsp. tularensis 79201237]EZK38151.1 hypothetical pr